LSGHVRGRPVCPPQFRRNRNALVRCVAILEAVLAAWRALLDLPVKDKRRAVELLAERIEVEIASWTNPTLMNSTLIPRNGASSSVVAASGELATRQAGRIEAFFARAPNPPRS
jgi:hypothetical protein